MGGGPSKLAGKQTSSARTRARVLTTTLQCQSYHDYCPKFNRSQPLQDRGGTHFVSVAHPDRASMITCSTLKNAIVLFELFFTEDMFELLVTDTNKNAHEIRAARGGKGNDYGGSKARSWYDTTVAECMHI